MMHIEHIAIWTPDIERLREFYARYFGGTAGEKYVNPHKHFQSYFLTFESGARLEIMQMEGIPASLNDVQRRFTGLIHLAFSVGSAEAVNQLTERLRVDGFPILDGPRRTGDGYYESVTLDPDGNRIEITI
jgi:lactoylglutathione lyase